MEKIKLPRVTIVAVAGNKQAETIASMYKSMAKVDFAKAILITNIEISCSGIEVRNVGGLETWAQYNEFIVKRLHEHFDTDYCLIVQHDSWVLSPECWTDEFYDFDILGAKWLDIGKPFNTSNGGFSLRSKKLQTVLGTDPMIKITTPEDVAINKVYGSYLTEAHGIKFCTEEIADKFAFELNEPMHKTFGFHSWHWPPFRETVMFSRSHALGDILQMEPVMHYYHKKGYQVAIDTNEYFAQFFVQHYFPVVPKNHLNPNLPYKTIDLSKAYEVFPDRLHLDSYYEFAQVPKEERTIRNPKLSLAFDTKQNRLFEKYVVIHYDRRSEAYRNIYNIDWEETVQYLHWNNYDVIQVGAGEREVIKGAIQMKTPTALMLMWVISAAEFFIGCDSGPSHIASGFDIPSILFFGSVNPELIHPNLTNKIIITNHKGEGVCNKPYCWSLAVGGETGTPCYIDNNKPPCTQYKQQDLFMAIKEMINANNISGSNR